MSEPKHRHNRYGHDFKRDPHAPFLQMRRETPIDKQAGLDGETPIWFVTRVGDVIAGHETTVNLIANGVRQLSRRFRPGFRALDAVPVRWG